MRFVVYLLSLIYCCFASAQTLTVLDRKSNEPIVHASLLDTVSNAYTWTDFEGKASFENLPKEAFLSIQALGYEGRALSLKQLSAHNYLLLLDPSNTELDQVVVSATKWRQARDKSPLKVVSLKPADIALQNPQTTADLIGNSGVVFIQKSQQGGGSPMIRGFAANRLIYTVDGVRMNNAIFRGGNIQNVISLDALSLQNAEVLLGPDAVVYGSDAIGGVMSFETLGPRYAKDEQVSVSARGLTRTASANFERTAHADLQLGSKKWAVTSSFTRTSFGDLRQGNNGPDDYLRPYYVSQFSGQDLIVPNPNPNRQAPSGYGQSNFMQKVFFRPNSKWDFSLAYHHSETSAFSRYDRQLRIVNDLPQYGQWDYGPQKWTMNQFTANHTKVRGIFSEMTLRLAEQNFQESRITRAFNDPIQLRRSEDVVAYSANLDLRKSISTKGELFYGIEWVLNQVNSIGVETNIDTNTSAAGPARYPKSDWTSYAIYLSYQHQWNSKLMTQGGLRYNGIGLDAQFDTRFYPLPFDNAKLDTEAVTGSIGLVYQPSSLWNFRANMATAFRAPNVDDIGKIFDSEPGSVVVPNPDLVPEYAISWDFGVAHMLHKKLKLDFSGYFTQLDNALMRRDFTLNGDTEIIYDGVLSRVQAIQNAAQSRVYGIHTGVELKLPSGFALTSDLNWQRGTEEMEDGTSSPARHAAPWFGATRLWFRAENLVIQGYSQYSGGLSYDKLAIEEQSKTDIYALDAQGRPYAPSWQTFNVKAQYSLDAHIDLIAGIENITDQRYRTYSSGISAAGRNLILALRAQI